jgi:hypothetical protein
MAKKNDICPWCKHAAQSHIAEEMRPSGMLLIYCTSCHPFATGVRGVCHAPARYRPFGWTPEDMVRLVEVQKADSRG